jgi:hypothetical protein
MEMVRIERFTSRVDAELACSMLTAHGFNARVSGDDVAGVHPDIPFGIGGTAIVVPADQYAEAIALLDQEFAGPLGDDPDASDDAEHTDRTADRDEHAAPWSREAERRPGLRVFAIVAAVGLLLVFAAATWRLTDWW